MVHTRNMSGAHFLGVIELKSNRLFLLAVSVVLGLAGPVHSCYAAPEADTSAPQGPASAAGPTSAAPVKSKEDAGRLVQSFKDDAEESNSAEMTPFKDGVFAFKFPSSWSTSAEKIFPTQIIHVQSKTRTATAAIARFAIGPSYSLDQFTNEIIGELKQTLGDKATLEASQAVTINGNKGNLVPLKAVPKAEGVAAKELIYLTVVDGTGYAAIFATVEPLYDNFQPVFKRIVNSIEIAAGTPAQAPAASQVEK